MFRYAAIFFLVAALIYGLWGIWDIFRGLLSGILWWGGYYSGIHIFYGIVRIGLAIGAIIFKGKFVDNIITPIDQGRYQESENDMVLYMILGFIFGLGIAGILILLGYMKFEEVDTQANKCPTCGGQLRFVQEYDRYYCDNCEDYKVPVHPPEPTTPQPPPSQQSTQQYQQPQNQPAQQSRQQPQQPTQQSSPSPPKEENKKICPTCGNEARWIEEYERYYCDNCQEYI